MKRSYLFLAFVVSFLFISCEEEDFCTIADFSAEANQLAIETAAIDQYLTDNGLTAEVHPSGIRYSINNPGNGRRPDGCTAVKVSYTGFLLDGTVFDETSPGSSINFPLVGLIPGWQIGLPLIESGGNIRLYIPSGYGYGQTGVGNIPGNSTLIFDIELKQVTNS